MLFNLFKKKSKEDVPDKEDKKKKAQKTIDEEVAKQEERDKKKKEQGPNLVPIYLLGITILAGIVFWLYGVIAESGLGAVVDSFPKSSDKGGAKDLQRRQDGLIIFERE